MSERFLAMLPLLSAINSACSIPEPAETISQTVKTKETIQEEPVSNPIINEISSRAEQDPCELFQIQEEVISDFARMLQIVLTENDIQRNVSEDGQKGDIKATYTEYDGNGAFETQFSIEGSYSEEQIGIGIYRETQNNRFPTLFVFSRCDECLTHTYLADQSKEYTSSSNSYGGKFPAQDSFTLYATNYPANQHHGTDKVTIDLIDDDNRIASSQDCKLDTDAWYSSTDNFENITRQILGAPTQGRNPKSKH